jgi:Uma2 family endonuclease
VTATLPHDRLTLDDLLTMRDGDYYELIDGNLVERSGSALASYVAGEVTGPIWEYLRQKPIGWVFSSGLGVDCFRPRIHLRHASASFIRRERFPNGTFPEGHIKFAPDLAIEVVPPDSEYNAVWPRIRDWFDAGSRRIWVIDPIARTVQVFRPPSRECSFLWRDDDELDGEDVLPGFRCRIGAFFLEDDLIGDDEDPPPTMEVEHNSENGLNGPIIA